ncbi:MAG: hypothetical protein ACXVJ0_13735, partial [Candidatus Angelobacter sp.]
GIDFRASKNQDARSKLPAVLRSLQRPTAQAFARYLSNQTTKSTILDHRGLPMSEVIDADSQRLNSTGIRMIRGLYFFETGDILPLNAKLRIAAKAGIHPHDEGAKTFAFAYSKCSDQRSKEIGSAFSYVVGFSPIASVWLILLYEYFVWMATVQI